MSIFAALASSCCCSAARVVLTAYVESWARTNWAHTRSNPTLPADTGVDPPCSLPSVEMGPAACTDAHLQPDFTNVECPDDPDNYMAIRLGTETYDQCQQHLYAAMTVSLLYVGSDVVGLGTVVWYREPPGGGTPEVIAAGVAEQDRDIFEGITPMQYPDLYETNCIHREGDYADIFMRVRWQARQRWATPPSAMDLLATGSGWTIEVTATTLVLVKPGPTTDTFTFGVQTFGDLQTWLNGKGVNTYRYTGASGALPATLAHPASMLVAFPATAVPETGTKMRLPMTAVNTPSVNDGTYDDNVSPYWSIAQWNNNDGTGGASWSGNIPLNVYDGLEVDFADGARADYAADVSGTPWGGVGGGSMAADMGATVNGTPYYFPTPGTFYTGSRYIAPSAGAPDDWASSVTDTTEGPEWAGGGLNCLSYCSAYRSKTGNGTSLQWQLQRVDV